ncbi:MAG: hypothetical protein HOK97_11025 [Deltaproteobacteria bacterium]|nr:hypothetical protein [Deltaproteobacteria bacterium]MBT6490286.1 hypothetical protein [Deltaproteobacteria bacterium]
MDHGLWKAWTAGDDSVEAGFDFRGYGWNPARLLRLEEGDTTGVVPWPFDESLGCADYFSNGLVGERPGLTPGDVFGMKMFQTFS